MAACISVHPDAAHHLALAMVSSSEAPLLLLDGDLAVVSASASFCRSFDVDPDSVADRPIFDLGAGEWDTRTLRSLLDATRSGNADLSAHEMDLIRPGQAVRELLIKACMLDFGHSESPRILVTVSDVTDARIAEQLKDELLREKAILLQEVQHRVANSLQIIATVLLQSARKEQSDETRNHLRDAHNRVMSIAAVQKQLATSKLDEVELRPYFNQLCESLGASMIADHDQLSIEVTADESKVRADVSVSLGLIVTELVINAIKHAFPDGRHGTIAVDYQASGPNWTLRVGDDGVGIPTDLSRAAPGLGSGIVEAVARQLRARVEVADAQPGTSVSIIHTRIPAVEVLSTLASVQ